MTEPTDDDVLDNFLSAFPGEPPAWHPNLIAGLRAVDRAAETRGYRRALDEIEAFLSHGFPPDGFVSVTEMQGRLRLMRGGQ